MSEESGVTQVPDLSDPVRPVSNSELQTYKRCRRKWWLKYHRQLKSRAVNPASALATGTRVHRALAGLYVPDGEPRQDPRDVLERAIVEDWTAYTRGCQVAGQLPDELTTRRFTADTQVERAMVEGYVEWLEQTGADFGLRVIAPETYLEVPFDLHDNTLPSVKLIGKIDVRIMRESDNTKLVLDHKTVGSLQEPQPTLLMDEQLLHYMLIESLRDEQERATLQSVDLSNDLSRTQLAETVALPLLPETDHERTGTEVGCSSCGREPRQQRTEQPNGSSLGVSQLAPQQGINTDIHQGAQAEPEYRDEEAGPSDSEALGRDEAKNCACYERKKAPSGSDRETETGNAQTLRATAPAERELTTVTSGALYNMLKKVKRTGAAKPPFYERIEVRHNRHELEAFQWRLVGTITDLLWTTQQLNDGENPLVAAYPTPTRQCSWDCEFRAVCPLLDDGSRAEDMINSIYVTQNPLAYYESEETMKTDD